jgi:hypothetical protein
VIYRIYSSPRLCETIGECAYEDLVDILPCLLQFLGNQTVRQDQHSAPTTTAWKAAAAITQGIRDLMVSRITFKTKSDAKDCVHLLIS